MIIKKGTILYRGSHHESISAVGRVNKSPNYLRANLPVYFARNKNNVRKYGTAVKYETTKNLHLLDMGDPEIVTRLIQIAKSEKVKKSLAKSFRVINGIVRRSSKIKYDIDVAVFACRLGFDGYYAKRLPQKYLGGTGTFHPEVVLCDARRVLKVVGIEEMLNAPNNRISVNNNLRRAVAATNYSLKN